MRDALNVLLGANGDLCCLLPLFKAQFDETGKKPTVFLSKDYMPLMEGVSYVTPVEWPGNFLQLRVALEFLKSDLPQVPVRVIQYAGEQKDIHFPSFVHEMWYQAGGLAKFGKLPLVFDRRDPKIEKELFDRHDDGGRIILVATKGRSSPFKHAKELMDDIRREFGGEFNIVDLSKVKAGRPFDLLGLYDRAAALVTIDTMHAHLARASGVPTLVLARDYPSLWHGIPYETRFRFYCRYGQWQHRRHELLRELRDAVDGIQKPKMVPINSPRGAYNPSRIEHNGKNTMTARIHTDPRKWQTRLIAGNSWPWHPVAIPTPEDWSHEDMRLFAHNRKLFASFVASQKRRGRWYCKIGFGKLMFAKNHGGYLLGNIVYPRIGRNDMTTMEKNWVFFSTGGRLHVIYKCFPRHIVYEISNTGKPLKKMVTTGVGWKHGEVRGGTHPIRFKGKWLRFFHSMEWEPMKDMKEWWIESLAPYSEWKRVPFRYHMGALIMDDKPPFKILQVSSHPILSGTEEWLMAHPKFKPNVVIPYGAIHKDGTFTVSIGVNDAWCREVYLTESQLNLTYPK